MTKTRIFKGKTVDGVYHFNYNKILVFIVAFADGTGLRIMIDNEEPPKLTYGWFGKERFQKMVDYHTNQGIHSEDHLSFYKVHGRRQRVR
jgi:hypothetical protein